MKILRSKSVQFIAIASLMVAGLAQASGVHGGGHGGDETAIGKPGVAAKAKRTITIEMTDNMRFTPADIQVKQGETVRFIVKNKGQIKHEMGLGTEKEILKHLEEMKKFPNMEHDEPGKVTLAPGKEGEIVWQFTKAGTVNFACLMPGHFEGGMKGAVKVGKS
jgi:uncharacterized cupredoxin-like copper-binding protein